jgi:hypothetical protein
MRAAMMLLMLAVVVEQADLGEAATQPVPNHMVV